MQEQCRRHKPRDDVAQVNHLVEVVQLPRVVERRHDEAGQAQQKEVQRPLRVPPTEIDEQPDEQVHHADGVLVKDGRITIGLADDDRSRNFDAVALVGVVRASPRAQPREHLGGLERIVDVLALDRHQHVAFAQSSLQRRAARGQVHRSNTVLIPGGPVDPGHSVIGEMVPALLLEIDRRRDHCSHGQDYQQGADELLLQLLHPASLYTTPINY